MIQTQVVSIRGCLRSAMQQNSRDMVMETFLRSERCEDREKQGPCSLVMRSPVLNVYGVLVDDQFETLQSVPSLGLVESAYAVMKLTKLILIPLPFYPAECRLHDPLGSKCTLFSGECNSHSGLEGLHPGLRLSVVCILSFFSGSGLLSRKVSVERRRLYGWVATTYHMP